MSLTAKDNLLEISTKILMGIEPIDEAVADFKKAGFIKMTAEEIKSSYYKWSSKISQIVSAWEQPMGKYAFGSLASDNFFLVNKKDPKEIRLFKSERDLVLAIKTLKEASRFDEAQIDESTNPWLDAHAKSINTFMQYESLEAAAYAVLTEKIDWFKFMYSETQLQIAKRVKATPTETLKFITKKGIGKSSGAQKFQIELMLKELEYRKANGNIHKDGDPRYTKKYNGYNEIYPFKEEAGGA